MKEQTLQAKLAMTLVFFSLLASASLLVAMSKSVVYEQNWTYTYVNEPPYGNWTYTRKPVAPMKINSSQIQIGANWTYVYTLTANRTYHVYCYGDWVDDGASPKTDYDIYVYNQLGELEGYHTEAAGLPEHLGTTVDEPFFTPSHTGNYTFVVRNDPRESQSTDAATFMTIENVEPNLWHTSFIEGKQDNETVENTCWAYEFRANSEQVEIRVQVPDTLDMYEARLYLMANPSRKEFTLLNGVPLAWEPGLYGQVDKDLGGYNLDSKGFRGEAYASCEDFGQDMLINYTAPYKGESLYHLVLIGESGAGNLSFRVKTNFGDSELKLTGPIGKVYTDNETIITAISNNSLLQQAFLQYSIDNWNTSTFSEMTLSNRTCNATVPGQAAGVTVSYRVEAYDFLDNKMTINGTYTVKHQPQVNFTLNKETVTLGENVSIGGFVAPALNQSEARVKLIFKAANGTTVEQYRPLQGSNFSTSFKPFSLGSWSFRVEFSGDRERHDGVSITVSFIVVEPSFIVKYSMFIYAGVGITIAALIVVFLIRRRQ
ncbi:MAG: hypothetical protein WCC63_06025 [Candidatus Bathyarchaeia archaeon]